MNSAGWRGGICGRRVRKHFRRRPWYTKRIYGYSSDRFHGTTALISLPWPAKPCAGYWWTTRAREKPPSGMEVCGLTLKKRTLLPRTAWIRSWRWMRRYRDFPQATPGPARWSRCTSSAVWVFRRSRSCWTSPSAPSSATGSSRRHGCSTALSTLGSSRERMQTGLDEGIVRELFTGALELPFNSRAAFLDRECGTEGILRERVKALLDSYSRADDYFS